MLVDWGVKAVAANNSAALRKITELIQLYSPDVIISEDLRLAPFRHSSRIHALSGALTKLAEKSGIAVKQIPILRVKKDLLHGKRATKYDIAKELALRFPDELGHLLPPKRLPWMAEHYRMSFLIR
jgi:hypothetical protein